MQELSLLILLFLPSAFLSTLPIWG